MSKTIAVAISRICGPESVVPAAIWLLTNAFFASVDGQLLVLLVTGICFVALPIATFGVFFYLGKLSDIDVTDRRERPLVLLVKQVWWTVGLIVLGGFLDTGVLFGVYAWWYVVGLTALVVSLVWKISLHTLSMTTLAIVALYIFPHSYVLGGFVGLLAAVGWSRWYLKKHTVAQLTVGMVVPLVWWGIALTLMAK